MPNIENAPAKLNPLFSLSGAITNLKQINDIPEILCWSMLFTDDMVARVSSSAKLCMWLMLAIANASWKPMPMHTKIKQIKATFGCSK